MSFAKSIGAWASATEKRIDAVHKGSLEKLSMEMTRTVSEGGNVPLDTGNLYRSLAADNNAMPKTADGPFTGSNATAVIAKTRIDQPVWFGYQAGYARRMNFGFVGADSLGRVYNQNGYHFVERAISMWPQIVSETVQELKNANS